MKASAIILAGGKSSRFGADKSLLRVDNEMLIERSLHRWGPLFSEIIIASGNEIKFKLPGIKEVSDIYPNTGPLGGVHAGLSAVTSKWAFVVACDMPAITTTFINSLFKAPKGKFRIIIPTHNGVIEPLCALYHIECLDVAEKMLAKGTNCILDMYDLLPVSYIKTENCFFNINFPNDFTEMNGSYANISHNYKRRLHRFCIEKRLSQKS